jgi:hypothetical protein
MTLVLCKRHDDRPQYPGGLFCEHLATEVHAGVTSTQAAVSFEYDLVGDGSEIWRHTICVPCATRFGLRDGLRLRFDIERNHDELEALAHEGRYRGSLHVAHFVSTNGTPRARPADPGSITNSFVRDELEREPRFAARGEERRRQVEIELIVVDPRRRDDPQT